MFIVCFVFAVIGYHYFGNINVKYASYLNEQLNFSSFSNSLISVFIFCTGEGWPFALADCSGKSIHYSCNSGSENCGSKWAIIYFITLQVIFNWILLNSFVAITVDTFVTVLEEHDEIIRLEKVWNAFNQQWIKYDWNKSGDLTFVELVNMYNSFKLPKGTEWGNQNRENGLLVVKPSMEELFKNVKVYKNRCKYHDVIFGFLNSWMGEELPESFLVREKEKVKTGYEKKVFEKRKNSIYSLDSINSDKKKSKADRMWEKSKKMYGKVAKALSLRSSKKGVKDVNIHILVENIDQQEDNEMDDDDTLNSDTPITLDEDYIRMNMQTCSGRLQNVYTANLREALRANNKDSNPDTPTTATPTTGTTIFNMFDTNRNDFSSDTLNELSRTINDDKEKEKEKEPVVDKEKPLNKKPIVREDSLHPCIKRNSSPITNLSGSQDNIKSQKSEDDKTSNKNNIIRDSHRNLVRNTTNYTLGSTNHNLLRTDNNINNEAFLRRQEEEDKYKNRGPLRRNNSHRHLKRTSTNYTLGNQNPNLLRTDSIVSNETLMRQQEEEKYKNRGTLRRDNSHHKLKRNSTNQTIQNPNFLRTDSIVSNEPFCYRPQYMNPISSSNNNSNSTLAITGHNAMTFEPCSYESGSESQYPLSSLRNDSLQSMGTDRLRVANKRKTTEPRIDLSHLENKTEGKLSPTGNLEDNNRTINFALKKHIRNNRHQTLTDFRKPERLTLSNVGRSKSYDSNFDIYHTPIDDNTYRSIIELDAIMGVDDEEEEKKNKHKSINIKNNLHRIKSRTSFRMGFKDNYLDNDIVIDVNNQGLPFHVVYAIYQIQQKFKNSRKEKGTCTNTIQLPKGKESHKD